jgi:acetyltransferase-like isoleucine patch superfamily enzyme
MRGLLNSLISKIKGESFTFDKRIPAAYMRSIALERLMMLARGIITPVRKKGYFFRGSNTKIKCKKKIRFGRNVTIAANCYIDALSVNGITLGNNVSLGRNTTIECTGTMSQLGVGLTTGNGVGFGTHGFFGCAGGIYIGDNTIFGNYVTMHSENHIFTDILKPIKDQGVTRKGIIIGSNCWIGAKVTILDGVKVEDGCILAAGSVLTAGTFESNGIYGGNPAKLIRKRT